MQTRRLGTMMVDVDTSEDHEPVRFRGVDERNGALVSDPLISDERRLFAAERDEGIRIHARGLAEIRKARNLTQRELAVLLGTDQGTVSRIERRDDLLLSTLRQYLVAAGAEHPKIVAEKDGLEIVLELDTFKDLH